MRKGALFADAASRLMWAELGLRLASDRFHLIGYYSLLWDTRAQAPVHNGCHTLSVAHTILLTDVEAAEFAPNEEYDATMWGAPDAVLSSPEPYHPALAAMLLDLVYKQQDYSPRPAVHPLNVS